MAGETLRAQFGETAAFGTDDVYMLIDPEWQQMSERQRSLCKTNCIALARNLFENGLSIVLIAGNALYDKAEVNDYIAALSSMCDLYHFTLVADVETLVDRLKKRGDDASHSIQFVVNWLALIEQHAGPWTCFIDTTQHSPEEVLATIVRNITSGEGRLGDTISL